MKKQIARKFLFFDNWTYESLSGFTRKTHKPVKFKNNPVFVANNNQYEYNSCSYSTVSYDYDEKIFKMWYGTSNLYKTDEEAIKYLCYATSSDGIKWDRPNLDVIDGTNVVMDKDMYPMGASVIIDKEDKNMPYKLIMRPKNIPAITTCFSKDGIHWDKKNINIVINADSDCKIGLYKNPVEKTYYALFRNIKGQRKNYISSSKDFINWDFPKLILEPDISEGCQTQIYGTQASSYGNYVIGLSPLYNTVETDMNWAKMEGTMDISAAFSKGSYNWRWLNPKDRFISLKDEKTSECGMIHPLTSLIYLPEKIRMYYAASDFSHGNTHLITQKPQYINFAELRPDGFTSIACDEAGYLLTRPFSVSSSQLYINANCNKGTLRASIRDAYTNQPIEGFNFKDCIAINTDEIYHQIEWKNNEGVNRFDNRPIRLAIECKNVEIFSITFPNNNDVKKYWEFDEITCVNPKKDISEDDYFMKI